MVSELYKVSNVSNQIINVGEALGSIYQPRVSIPEWEMASQWTYIT